MGYGADARESGSGAIVQSERTPSVPGVEEFNLIFHFVCRPGGDELQQTARLLAHRIALLPSQDDARVGLTMRQVLPVNSVKIPNIERVENTPLLCSHFEVPFVRPSDHASFRRGQHINATGTQRMDKVPVHCVFVNIYADRHEPCRER